MNLEQFDNIRTSIEDSMFADSATKSMYDESVKQRLIYKNSVEYLANGRPMYVPQETMEVKHTAGVCLNDGNGSYGDISKQLIIAKNSAHAFAIMKQFNDDAYSITSQGTPQYLTTIWTNKVFEVITRAKVFEQVSHPFQQGMFGITNIKIMTLSGASNPALYSDYGVQGDSSINVNWIDRQVVNFERMLIYGDLQVAQMSMGKVDYVGRQRTLMLEQIKLHQDAIGFFGYSENMQLFGLLNDPSLNPTLTAGIKAGAPAGSASTLWLYATFFELIADIQSLYGAIVARAGGHLGTDEKCYLLIPPAVFVNLMTTTAPLGNIPFEQWLKLVFPNMQIIQAPLLQGTGTPIGSVVPNQCVLIFDNIEGQECLLNAFVTLYNSHGVVRLASSYQEKISYVLGGAIISNAIGIQIMQGI